jgi:hypothetical protein
MSGFAKRAFERQLPTLEVECNELCTSQDAVLDFLQMPRRTLTSQLEKQREGTQADAIVNYEELREKFADSRATRMFAD